MMLITVKDPGITYANSLENSQINGEAGKQMTFGGGRPDTGKEWRKGKKRVIIVGWLQREKSEGTSC